MGKHPVSKRSATFPYPIHLRSISAAKLQPSYRRHSSPCPNPPYPDDFSPPGETRLPLSFSPKTLPILGEHRTVGNRQTYLSFQEKAFSISVDLFREGFLSASKRCILSITTRQPLEEGSVCHCRGCRNPEARKKLIFPVTG